MHPLQEYWMAFINWFYPHRCASCRCDLPFDETRFLCPFCTSLMEPLPKPYCSRCGVHLPDGGQHCRHCRRESPAYECVRSYGLFQSSLRNTIHRFKYDGSDHLGEELAQLLFQAWTRYPELHRVEVVMAVPLHAQAQRERGFNQSMLLGRQFVHLVNGTGVKPTGTEELMWLEGALVRTRNTDSQTRLSREERIRNLEAAFRVRDPRFIRGKSVLMIDDVCTTGSTLNECAKVLLEAGADKVSGLTLARDA